MRYVNIKKSNGWFQCQTKIKDMQNSRQIIDTHWHASDTPAKLSLTRHWHSPRCRFEAFLIFGIVAGWHALTRIDTHWHACDTLVSQRKHVSNTCSRTCFPNLAPLEVIGFLPFSLMCRLQNAAPPGSPSWVSQVPPDSPWKFPKPRILKRLALNPKNAKAICAKAKFGTTKCANAIFSAHHTYSSHN